MIVFINTFHLSHAKDQQRVIELLTRVTRDFASKAPGFNSAILHRSTDGMKVTMYARWMSLAAYEAMRRDPTSNEALSELVTLARFDACMYEVVEEFAAPGV
jgi:heme-degrading monooxygenase HmoA